MITVRAPKDASLMKYAKFASLTFHRTADTTGVFTISIPMMFAKMDFPVTCDKGEQVDTIQKFIDALGVVMKG